MVCVLGGSLELLLGGRLELVLNLFCRNYLFDKTYFILDLLAIF